MRPELFAESIEITHTPEDTQHFRTPLRKRIGQLPVSARRWLAVVAVIGSADLILPSQISPFDKPSEVRADGSDDKNKI